ncbi:nif11-like leader peptide domain protein [Synechococcus sp. BIOS-E4-1]|uniref:Nif11-like leader peptide family RiPP precursor n=1 Tax=Synechococcus sp. BIOS-E4-1 TaxID=1400864 RepID=UPI001646FF73|nr:nif11-like leader peptide domain protein [Synechococcus sp. BIOS-E4-1]
MSSQIEGFKAKVASDATLRSKIQNASDAEIISLAAAAGFTITEKELRDLNASNLSEKELEALAGGAGDDYTKYHTTCYTKCACWSGCGG